MISANFESYNLSKGDELFFTDMFGFGYNGVYLDNYNRNKASFDFLNYSTGAIETVEIKKNTNFNKEIIFIFYGQTSI